jgi:hypothetical protein
MEDEYTSRLHSVALSESDESKKISDDKPIIKTKKCCFKTNEMNVYKIYDENDCLLCKCLDWCSWLSNIDCKKSSCCERNIICFMCCCSITIQ